MTGRRTGSHRRIDLARDALRVARGRRTPRASDAVSSAAPALPGRLAAGLTAALFAVIAACGGPAGPADRAAMSRADQVVDSLRASARVASLPEPERGAAPSVVSSEAAVALGYLERERLGFGSPFRLIDFALDDPRLRPELRRHVAWALLARASRGATYRVDASAFGEGGGVTGSDSPDARRAELHRRIVEETVSGARDPRTGEASVRLGYALARQEGLIGDRPLQAAVRTAAQARDRGLARADADRLLRATRSRGDAIGVVRIWRAERRFTVETPLLNDRMRAHEADAARESIRLLARLRRELGALDRTLTGEHAARLAAADLEAMRDSILADSLRLDALRADSVRADSARAESARRGRRGRAPRAVAATTPAAVDVPAPSDSATRALTAAKPAPAAAAERPSPPRPSFDTASWLPTAAARRLAALGERTPPQAPVAVMTSAYRRQLLVSARARDAEQHADGDSTMAGEAARERVRWETRWHFAQRARSEESLVAEFALAVDALDAADASTARARAELAGVTLASAVAMRAYAQETPWFPGFSAPTAAQLATRFGLRRVTFDPEIPTSWQPYYLRQIGDAIGELQRVLPTLVLDGLAVQVGESVKRDSALALHDPATRTVYLPAATAAGTIAHELAHDLDWQTARSRLATRGAYSTDRLARSGTGRLGTSIRGLTAARPRSNAAGSDRPAEVFARGVDWYVAAALARDGRMSGALTSVQDEGLTGYAGVAAPDPAGDAAAALTDVLDDMTLLPSASRGWFLTRFGRGRALDAATVVQAVVDASPSWTAERALRAVGASPLLAPPAGAHAVGSVVPTMPRCDTGDAELEWRAALLWAAADAKARGTLRARANGAVQPTRRSWEARAVGGGPWDPSLGADAVARLRAAILRDVARRDAERGPVAGMGVGEVIARCR